MVRSPNGRSQLASRGAYHASGGAYLFFCASVIFALALLTYTSLVLPPRVLPTVELPPTAMPVAAIQLAPDRNGLCRHLWFYNDTGGFEHGGVGACRPAIPQHLLAETVRSRRHEALARVFTFR